MDYDSIFGTGNKPTDEQLDIGKEYLSGVDLAIDAAAGASKTSSCIYMASLDTRKILYLAFNKSIVEDIQGKAPSNVEIRTIHSLAYGAVGHKYRHKLSRPKGGYVNVAGTSGEIARYYKLPESDTCSKVRLGGLVKDTVYCFENSADDKIDNKHIPKSKLQDIKELAEKGGLKYSEVTLKKQILRYAKRLWKDRVDVNSKVLATHDTYLRLYQESNPLLDYNCIICDEIQDVSACFFDIFMKQTCQRVMVGDPAQAIYQFKYCINGFEDKRVQKEFTRKTLSKSFRFGDAIANIGKDVLSLYVDKPLTGFGNTSVVGTVDKNKPFTVLYRTNGALLAEAIGYVRSGYSVKIEVDVKDFVKKLTSMLDLRAGKKAKHPDIVIYKTWEDLEDSAENDVVLARDVKLLTKGVAYDVISLLSNYTHPINPDVTLITSHRSKGREFDQVILAEDFKTFFKKDGSLVDKVNKAECNLTYVAATRAKKVLQLNNVVHEILAYKKNCNTTEIFGKLVSEEVRSLVLDYS